MASVTTSPGTCRPGAVCTADGTAVVAYWVPKVYTASEKTGTMMVVQVINTVLNTTSISTIGEHLPPGYTPPPTNAGGTRIANVTYKHHGTLLTTTL
jgi:hypothetical protein